MKNVKYYFLLGLSGLMMNACKPRVPTQGHIVGGRVVGIETVDGNRQHIIVVDVNGEHLPMLKRDDKTRAPAVWQDNALGDSIWFYDAGYPHIATQNVIDTSKYDMDKIRRIQKKIFAQPHQR